MPITIDIDTTTVPLSCTISGNFTPTDGFLIIPTLLAACARTGSSLVLLDLTAIKEPHSVSNKLMWAYEAEQAMTTYQETVGTPPRIAVLGCPPFLSTYKPASEHFEASNVSIRVFDCMEDAQKWLDQD
jgi:hypothetical protein